MEVLLLTSEETEDAGWPRNIDELFLIPNLTNREHMVNAVCYLARGINIDRIVALDEFDIEMAASLREHMRVPGMGETTSRYFRDKLAMRMRALEKGVRVPPFCQVLNYDRLREYMNRVPGPWMLKPRSSASAIGIKKIHSSDQLWPILEMLGDPAVPSPAGKVRAGEVYHVDSIVSEKKVVFAAASKYGAPQSTCLTMEGSSLPTPSRKSKEEKALEINKDVIKALGLVRGCDPR
ncbi:MAG: hypothetical protein IPG76_15415 [Acidobacteria bacterium]|nr:hypothetical protein [Acidobacteriota bacterium]